MRQGLLGGLKRHTATLGMVAFSAALVALGWGCKSESGSSYGSYDAEGSGNLPLSFEWNLGQSDAKYQIVGQAAGYRLALNGEEAVLELEGWARMGRSGRLTAKLENARRPSSVEAEDPLPGKANYFLGNEPERWITDVPTFRRARFRNVYPGIDVVYYGQGSRFEHDFVVQPGADPAVIAMSFSGRAVLNADGDLAIETDAGEVIWKRPELFQGDSSRRRKVEGRYKLDGEGRVRVEVGEYDARRPLVIDPVIVYGSYVGGNGSEFGTRVGVDAAGNTYFAGMTFDANYLVTAGAPRSNDPLTSVKGDVTVTKVNAEGSAIAFSTRLGGSAVDAGYGATVDSAGNVYVTGVTYSRNFPTTPGVFRPEAPNQTLNDVEQGDCFVTKLSTTGNRMAYSTYLGGNSSQDACMAITTDREGNAYLTGVTMSNNFPTSGAFQGVLTLGLKPVHKDAFVTKLSPDAARLVFSSFLGGNGDDVGTGIAVDSAGNVFVSGFTDSRGTSFRTTQGALQPQFKGGGNNQNAQGDGFVVKVDRSGEQLVYATYLGGSASDAALGIAVDAQGNAYVAGTTMSQDFPTAGQPFQAALKGVGPIADVFCTEPLLCVGLGVTQAGDAFVSKLNPAGTALVYSTYLGGSVDDRALAIAVDARGNAWVTGGTQSADFPLSADAQQKTYGGQPRATGLRLGDAFVTQLDAAGRALVYSSYIGGSGDDFGMGIAMDPAGNVYVSGATNSLNFPVTASAARRGYGGHTEDLLPAGDAFVVKIGEAPKVEEPRPAISGVANAASGVSGTVSPGQVVVIAGTNLGPAAAVSASATAAVLPLTLGETRVLFGQTAAPLVSVSATAVTAIAPFGLTAGANVPVTVEYKTVRSAAVAIPVAAAAPGLYTANGIGRGQAAAFNEDGAVNSVDAPAGVGSLVTLTGTGGGATEPVSADGAVAVEDGPALSQPVTVTFGDVAAEEIVAAGGVKGRAAGYFRIVVRIPLGVTAGDVPVVVSVGGAQSQSGVTVAVQNVEIVGEEPSKVRR